MSLAVPLLPSQIDAAQRLYARLDLWQATNAAFASLRQAFPGFNLEASLLKAAAINQLYGTNVYAIARMAGHISNVMRTLSDTYDDLALVEQIAALPDPEGGNVRRHLSFASKFAHFFISDERFPIYDSYAAMTLNYHLHGRAVPPTNTPSYTRYVAATQAVREDAGVSCSVSRLDAYLWLAGLAIVWRTAQVKSMQAKINAEVRVLFMHGEGIAAELEALLPVGLDKAIGR
jgi:hypothetical protein